MILSLENTIFVLAPSRPIATPGTQLSGLRMLLNGAKFVAFYMICRIAGGLGYVAYLLAGRQLWPALMAAWVVLALFAADMVPVAALAFRRFDVARDRPG